MLHTERNTRIEVIIAVGVVILGWWLQLSGVEWCIILLCIAGVIAAETINTSIEKIADFQSSEIHPEIRDIKDLAAGAVLVMAVVSVIIGLVVFGPKLYFRIS